MKKKWLYYLLPGAVFLLLAQCTDPEGTDSFERSIHDRDSHSDSPKRTHNDDSNRSEMDSTSYLP